MVNKDTIKSVTSIDSTFIEKKTLNILMLGETQVGKTALIKVYNEEHFPTQHYTTLGTEFIMKRIKINEETVKAKIWDTAGQERFRTITKGFYQQAQGILLVFDITKRETYSKLNIWIDNIQERTGPGIPICLIGNKVDLAEDRVVSFEEGKDTADKHHMDYCETSALLNKKVREAFESIITKAHANMNKALLKSSFQISSKNEKKKENCCQ